MWLATAVIVGAYAIGSIPFALLLARRWGADLRRVGSGNLGAANVLRASGITAALLVAVLDVAKGAISVALAAHIVEAPWVSSVAGAAAVVGHIYPAWLRFRGGKGVATACGVFAVLTPSAAVPLLAVFVAIVWATKYVSLASVVVCLALAPVAWATGSPAPAVGAAAGVAVLIIFRHRSNLVRLRAGTERRIGTRA